jgi:hypothetical protein
MRSSSIAVSPALSRQFDHRWSVRDVSGRDPHFHRPRMGSSRSKGGERWQKSDRIFEMRACCGGASSAHNGCAAPSSPCCTRACVHRPSGDHARCRAFEHAPREPSAGPAAPGGRGPSKQEPRDTPHEPNDIRLMPVAVAPQRGGVRRAPSSALEASRRNARHLPGLFPFLR